MSQKRIAKEYADLQHNPLEGIDISLDSESDLHKWQVQLAGPKDSPYSGGTFLLSLTLPPDYPFKPPTLNFQTKIYHPNVTNDEKGSMCLGMLRQDEWKPSSKIGAVLQFARQLLVEPVPDDAVEASIGKEYKEDRKEFLKKAKNWTKMYAGKK
jgi:ubiquitin-conjugating enzyme E2 D/E